MTRQGDLDTGELASATPGLRGKGVYFVVALVVLVLDQWTKWLVEAKLEFHDSVEVIPGFLDFTHVRNTGVAFGMFASHGDRTGTLLLAALGIAALGFVTYYFYLVPLRDRILLSALSLVMGGAVGNLADRLAQGGVTDFIDAYVGTYHWHTFNVADSAISVGIGLMILSAFRQPPEASDTEAAGDAGAPDAEPSSDDSSARP
ncbi:MAG: signal peptidase II [Acidobacteriota bacterium]